jgi:hypothetical protein
VRSSGLKARHHDVGMCLPARIRSRRACARSELDPACSLRPSTARAPADGDRGWHQRSRSTCSRSSAPGQVRILHLDPLQKHPTQDQLREIEAAGSAAGAAKPGCLPGHNPGHSQRAPATGRAGPAGAAPAPLWLGSGGAAAPTAGLPVGAVESAARILWRWPVPTHARSAGRAGPLRSRWLPMGRAMAYSSTTDCSVKLPRRCPAPISERRRRLHGIEHLNPARWRRQRRKHLFDAHRLAGWPATAIRLPSAERRAIVV